MTTQSEFYRALAQSLFQHAQNFHGTDNWDAARFGKRRKSLKHTVAEIVFFLLPNAFLRLNLFLRPGRHEAIVADKFTAKLDGLLASHGAGLANTYNMLADDYSRHALVEVMAYRLLGFRHVKLWTNTPDYWSVRAVADSLATQGSEIETGIDILRLSQTDLRPIGYPITVFAHPISISHQFLLTQYAYKQITPPIWLREGDYVIDAGAAWGETALRFAHEVGEQGRIYSFEFEPQNLKILERNLGLNPQLASRITVVERALWSNSSTLLTFSPQGPGTKVSQDVDGAQEQKISSISIDDFAKSLPRVDFIKMDIEGAELFALQGAEQTLRKHRPNLAISLYHSLSDFVDIPAYLASLGLAYDYYLDHATIHREETVLFATKSPRD